MDNRGPEFAELRGGILQDLQAIFKTENLGCDLMATLYSIEMGLMRAAALHQ